MIWILMVEGGMVTTGHGDLINGRSLIIDADSLGIKLSIKPGIELGIELGIDLSIRLSIEFSIDLRGVFIYIDQLHWKKTVVRQMNILYDLINGYLKIDSIWLPIYKVPNGRVLWWHATFINILFNAFENAFDHILLTDSPQLYRNLTPFMASPNLTNTILVDSDIVAFDCKASDILWKFIISLQYLIVQIQYIRKSNILQIRKPNRYFLNINCSFIIINTKLRLKAFLFFIIDRRDDLRMLQSEKT